MISPNPAAAHILIITDNVTDAADAVEKSGRYYLGLHPAARGNAATPPPYRDPVQ